MPEKKPYPGTISSIILSVIVVMILLVPFATANHLQKVRDGEVKYEFGEVMCWDIDNVNQFDNTHTRFDPIDPFCSVGTGALVHFQWGCRKNGWCPSLYFHNEVFIHSTPIDGVVGDYTGVTIPPSDCNPSEEDTNFIHYAMSFDKSEILDLDITRIDIFIDIQNVELDFVEMSLKLMGIDEWTPSVFSGIKIQVGELTQITVSVDDLLSINALFDEGEQLAFWFNAHPGYIPTEVYIVFDMQFYHIEEIEIITVDYMGIAMIGGGIFMGFCAILMLPVITFRGVISRIVGKKVD